VGIKPLFARLSTTNLEFVTMTDSPAFVTLDSLTPLLSVDRTGPTALNGLLVKMCFKEGFGLLPCVDTCTGCVWGHIIDTDTDSVDDGRLRVAVLVSWFTADRLLRGFPSWWDAYVLETPTKGL